jgi:hypothetical protein
VTVTLPALAPGAAAVTSFRLDPTEPTAAAVVSIDLSVTSAVGGSYRESVEQRIHSPARLVVPARVARGSTGFPLLAEIRVLNVGDDPTDSGSIDVRLPDDIQPGSIIVTFETQDLPPIAAREEHVVTVAITTVLTGIFHLEVVASDAGGRTASGLLTVVRQP